MKKLFKILVLSLLVIVSAFSLFACVDGDVSDEPGIYCKKFTGEDFYTLYKYVDDGETTVLDLGAKFSEKYPNAELRRISTNAFENNQTLTEVKVPNTVTEIQAGAFSGMKSLESITLPFVGNLVKADAYMYQTAEDTDKAVDAQRSFLSIFGEKEYTNGAKITANYGAGTKDYYVPVTLNSVTIAPKESGYEIPMYAFAGVTQINNVTLTQNVTGIGEYAFNKADSIVNITIPNSVTKIYKCAFMECANLVTVTLAENNAGITLGDKAFYNCQALQTFNANGNAITLGVETFAKCDNLA